MGTQVYMIVGETGEYADRSDWIVKAYFDSHDANEYLELLNTITAKYEIRKTDTKFSHGFLEREDREALQLELKPLDGRAYADYTGTRYSIQTITVE